LKEKCREQNILLCIASVDYKETFTSMKIQAVLISLQEQGMEDMYIKLLNDIYTYTKKATRSTLAEGYDRETLFHPTCLWLYSKAYSEDQPGKLELEDKAH